MVGELDEILRTFITHVEPFGPSKTEDLWSDDLDAAARMAAFVALYDAGNDIHHQVEKLSPNCLIGRKGSGKTAFLYGLAARGHAHVIPLKQSNVFVAITNLIGFAHSRGSNLLVDHVAEIWMAAVAHAVAVEVVLTNSQNEDAAAMQTLWSYLRGFRDKHPTINNNRASDTESELKTPDAIVDQVIGHFQWKYDQSPFITPDQLLSSLEYDGVTYPEMSRALHQLLKQRDLMVYVVIDSLEDLTQQMDKLAEATRGLLHLLNDHSSSDRGFKLFVGLPAEAMDVLHMISSNPAKNMNRSIHIRWRARDLVDLAVHRFTLYLRLYEPEIFKNVADDPGRREIAREALAARLPSHVRNAQGHDEPTIAYILRHTHLLPRQLLRYLNGIWAKGPALRDERAVSQEAVREGIMDAEVALLHDVFIGYEAHHGSAKEICERVIPYVNNTAPARALLHAIRRSGVARFTGGDERDVLQMLVDIGAIGRFMRSTEIYAEAQFNFHVPGGLRVHEDEQFCVHPMYSRKFETLPNRRAALQGQLAVYPYGVDFDGLLSR